MSKTLSVRGAAVWAMAGQYIGFSIQFITTVIISRLFLSPAETGLFSIALSAALMVSILQDFGLTRYISGLPQIDNAEIRRCSAIALLFSLVVVALIAGLAWPLSQLYALPDLAPLLVIIASSYLFLPLTVVPMALLARDMRFDRHFLVNVGGAAIQAATAISLAAYGFSAYALAWAAVSAAITRACIAQILRPAIPWPFRFEGLSHIIGFGSRSSVLYISGALGTRTPDLILGKLVTLTAVGLYSRASSLSDQFRTLISGAIGSVFFPAFARFRDRGEPLGPPYLRVCTGYSAIVWPGMAFLALAATPIVHILFGENWMGVAPLLTLISLAEIFLVALPLVTDIPVVLGKLNRLIAYNLVDTALSIILLTLGAWWGGIEGAAASRIVYAVGWLFIYSRFMHRLIGFDIKALFSIYIRSALATIATIMPLALAYAVWAEPTKIGFIELAMAAVLGAVSWFITLITLRHPALNEIMELARAIPIIDRCAARFKRVS